MPEQDTRWSYFAELKHYLTLRKMGARNSHEATLVSFSEILLDKVQLDEHPF